MGTLYVDLTGPGGGTKNPGGLAQKHYFSPMANITTLATLPSAPAAEGEYSTITDDHVLAAGKKWFEVYCTADMGELNFEPQGEADGESLKPTCKLFVPGAGKKLLDSINQFPYDRFVWLIQAADGQKFQLGTERFPARTRAKMGFGKNASGVRGVEIEIMVAVQEVIVYEGAIDTTA